MIEYPFEPNTPEWRDARRGGITASRAKDVRRTNGLNPQQQSYVNAILRQGKSEAEALEAAGYKKKPTSEDVAKALAGKPLPLVFSEAAHSYAKQLARERMGGKEPEGFQGLAQRVGHEEEGFAAIEYVAVTGSDVEPAFYITTDDHRYGMTLDRWVLPSGETGVQITVTVHGTGEVRHFLVAGALEVKTMVSSATLFLAMVDGDISEYRDQCLFGLWLFNLPWIDLCLWCPDLRALHVVRIVRDEDEIQALEDDLIAFDQLVEQYVAKLKARISRAPEAPWDASPLNSLAPVAGEASASHSHAPAAAPVAAPKAKPALADLLPNF